MTVATPLPFVTPNPAPRAAPGEEPDGSRAHAIGHFLRRVRALTELQIGQILAYQRSNSLRFGEAAIALKLATSDDVLWALSQQFDYPYANGDAAPFDAELVAATDPFGEGAEAFRELRSQLLMGVFAEGQARRALAVLSPDSGDGRSYFAANLAISFSQLGGRTLLVDGDMRTPRQHRLFRVDGEAGLSSILAGRAEVSVIHQVPNLPTLFVLPVGTLPPNPLELLQRPATGLLVQELLTKFDHVIVDTPAALHGADARILAARSGAAVLIGRRGRTRIKALQALLGALATSQVRMAGVMLNEH